MRQKGFKEWLRKKIVYLKRNTRVISLLLLIASCLVFTLKMSDHSQAVMLAPDNFRYSAVMFFAITLMSIMSIFSFVGFKKFNKKSLMPLLLTLGLLALQIVFDIIYIKGFTDAAATGHANYVPHFVASYKWMTAHLICIAVTVLSIASLPLITKLLGRIDTSLPEERQGVKYDNGGALVDTAEDE